MNKGQILATAERLDALRDEVDELRASCVADTPILDAFATAIGNWGVLRKGDGLTVEVTPFTEWRFLAHSSGAYLDAYVHVIVNRNGQTERAEIHARVDALRTGDTVTARQWETNDGRTVSSSVWISNGDIPNAARRIITERATEEWNKITGDTVTVWREALIAQAASNIRSRDRWAIAVIQHNDI
jgi:hypothetical protein